MKRSPSTIGQRCLASACLVSVVVACQAEPTKPGARNLSAPDAKATRVETTFVGNGGDELTLTLPGEVEAARDARVASAIGGYVEKVLVKEGQRVRPGQSLAWINRAIADAGREQAQAQLDLAEHEMSVVEKAGDSLSQSRRVRARAGLRSARAAYTQASVNAARARVTAPFGGVIASVYVEQGEVSPPGGPVARLVQLDPINVSLSISDRDIRWVQPGARAVVLADGGSNRIEAEVTRVSPAADLSTRTFIAEIELDNPSHTLLPGMMVTTMVSRHGDPDAVTIPQDALVTRGDGNGVFVVEQERARWRSLELGGLVGHSLVVRAGLDKGDELIVRGHRELSDGEALVVLRADGASSMAAGLPPQSDAVQAIQ